MKKKVYGYRVQKDDHEIKDSEFIKANGIKKYLSEELKFNDFDNHVYVRFLRGSAVREQSLVERS